MRHAIDNGGKVLVHCYAGVSRSSSTVMMFLMREYGISMNEAYKITKEKRWFINPNTGFKRQLNAFEKSLPKDRVIS